MVVQRDINNKPLSKYNQKHTFYTIPFDYCHKLNLKEGDIISIVWDKDNPDNIKVRWLYRQEELSDSNNTSVKKKSKSKRLSSEKEDYTPTLNFDLHNQTVGLFTADDSIMSNLAKVVLAHNGKPTIITLKSGTIAKNKTESYDIVILMQSYIKHAVSNSAIEEAKSNDTTKIAMAQSASQLSLEKALYRAENGLNVAEAQMLIIQCLS